MLRLWLYDGDMKSLLRTGISVTSLLALSIALASCTSPSTNEASSDEKLHSSEHGSHSMEITGRKSFALAMIPHHEQAVEMSQLALENTSNPVVIALAEKIITEQSAEIEMMTPWLEEQALDYEMIMDGMLTSNQLEELRAARDSDFDALFSQYMIMHHEVAVEMANQVIEIEDIFLSELGYQIIEQQTQEISELETISKN
jgi:uncharacterized protein (DUF305 family)